jgi:hypothetical protein
MIKLYKGVLNSFEKSTIDVGLKEIWDNNASGRY